MTIDTQSAGLNEVLSEVVSESCNWASHSHLQFCTWSTRDVHAKLLVDVGICLIRITSVRHQPSLVQNALFGKLDGLARQALIRNAAVVVGNQLHTVLFQLGH